MTTQRSTLIMSFILALSGCDAVRISPPAEKLDSEQQVDANRERARIELEKAKADAARAEAELLKAQAEAAKAEAQAARDAARSAAAAPATRPNDPVGDFKSLAQQIEASLNGLVDVKYNRGTKAWSRFRIAISETRIDVKQSDSLLAPFTGVMSFNVDFQHAGKFATADQAENAADNFAPSPNSSPVIANFHYSDGRWQYTNAMSNLIPGTTSWEPVSDFFADPVASTIADVTERMHVTKP